MVVRLFLPRERTSFVHDEVDRKIRKSDANVLELNVSRIIFK